MMIGARILLHPYASSGIILGCPRLSMAVLGRALQYRKATETTKQEHTSLLESSSTRKVNELLQLTAQNCVDEGKEDC